MKLKAKEIYIQKEIVGNLTLLMTEYHGLRKDVDILMSKITINSKTETSPSAPVPVHL